MTGVRRQIRRTKEKGEEQRDKTQADSVGGEIRRADERLGEVVTGDGIKIKGERANVIPDLLSLVFRKVYHFQLIIIYYILPLRPFASKPLSLYTYTSTPIYFYTLKTFVVKFLNIYIKMIIFALSIIKTFLYL